MKKLSVIISNRNDLAMLSVTVRSCIEELRFLDCSECEIVIADNSDKVAYDNLKHYIPQGYIRQNFVRIYRQDFPCLFTARELAAEKAMGRYIACVDSHMIIGRSMFEDLYNFISNVNERIGFAHAPINWAHQHESASKHDRNMSVNELGDWGLRRNINHPITWKGMPWICNRKWFLSKGGLNGYGALSQHRLSWGGGDMHIGIKPWLLGYKNYAVATNPGIHIGPFPSRNQPKNRNVTLLGDGYRLYSASGSGPHALGFLVSCYVLGGEPMMERNADAIRNRFGRFIKVSKHWEEAKELGQDEKDWLDKNKIVSFERLLEIKPWEWS